MLKDKVVVVTIILKYFTMHISEKSVPRTVGSWADGATETVAETGVMPRFRGGKVLKRQKPIPVTGRGGP
jgi:hypothetical protein